MAFANNSSLFGAKPATPAPSLFGSTTGTTAAGAGAAPAKPLFGGGTSLFGQPQQSTTATQSSTGLFGQQQQQPGAANATAATTMGLFGQPQQQAAATTPATGGTSLFGQPQQQPQSGTTSLFGGQTAGTTSLFGQPAAATQPSTTTSLFGQSTTATQPQQGASVTLFGQPQQQQQQPQTGSLFGTAAAPLMSQPTVPAFGATGGGLGASTVGSSLFGQQAKPQPFGQSTAPVSNQVLLSKSTKFNDLPDEMKKTFESIDAHIQGRIQISKDLHQRKLGEEALKGRELLRGVHKELVHTASTTHADALLTRDLKAKADQAVQDTIIATRIVDGFRNPQQHGVNLKNHATFPLEYFTRITDQMRERLQWYKATIDQIERKLSSSTNQAQYTPQAISATLQAQHATFIALANKTAAVDAELQKLKTLYTQLWRAKTGSMRDPFDSLGQSSSGDFGMGSLNV